MRLVLLRIFQGGMGDLAGKKFKIHLRYEARVLSRGYFYIISPSHTRTVYVYTVRILGIISWHSILAYFICFGQNFSPCQANPSEKTLRKNGPGFFPIEQANLWSFLSLIYAIRDSDSQFWTQRASGLVVVGMEKEVKLCSKRPASQDKKPEQYGQIWSFANMLTA